jgi:hypothetical protein
MRMCSFFRVIYIHACITLEEYAYVFNRSYIDCVIYVHTSGNMKKHFEIRTLARKVADIFRSQDITCQGNIISA